jgi:SPP1 gp7 family putative phage head morphogenesis protein
MATIRITGPRLRQLKLAEVRYTNRMMRAVRRTVSAVRAQLDPVDPVGSVGVITDLWRVEVSDDLRPALGDVWRDAAADTRARLQVAANDLARRTRRAEATTSAAFRSDLPDIEIFPEIDDDAEEIILVDDDLAEAYLATRENFLVGVGDDIWQLAREQLLEGMAAGEGIDELSERLTTVVGLTAGRATRVARTEVVGAANAGSIEQMLATVSIATKEWVSTDDARTRPDHVEADGQVADLTEPFIVGGVPMQRPHDPLGGPEQVVNCRCTMIYEIPEEELMPDLGLTAAAEQHTGAMIALIPTEEDLDRLAVEGGEPRDELHLTLFFLGLAADLEPATRAELERGLRDIATREGMTPVTGRAFGVNYWNPSSDDPALVLAVGDTDGELTLESLREAVREVLAWAGDLEDRIPAQHTPWVPHVTLMYGNDTNRITEFAERLGDITFDRIRLAFGGEVTDVPIGGDFATVVPDGGGVMPAKTTETLAEGDELAFTKPASWHGVLAVEGIETGDGREFAPESLTWADLPIPLRRNIEDSHGGEMKTTAVLVGRIDEIERVGNKIMGRGVFDLGGEHGREAARLVSEGFLKGVSVDVDAIKDADVELIMPESDDDEDEDDESGLIMLFTAPEKVIFHSGRVRAATLVDIPAFVEAFITIDEDVDTDNDDELGLVAAVTATTSVVALGAVGTHDTATSDGPWDGPANEQRLDSPLSVDTARNVYAWIDDTQVEDGTLPKSAGKFPHHEVDADGTPGAANLTACSAGIAALNGARGGADIPAADRQGVWNHLAAHLRDGGQEPPPLQMEEDTVTASGTVDDRPPREWFADPKLPLPTPIVVTDEGRVYGHAAMWGACHVGFADVCVSPPHEDSHPYYMTGEVVCADGARVAVGQITVGTGHAPLHVAASRAAEHYDNTGAAVADVCVGNDEHGIWIAGAIRGDASAARVRDLRAAGQVSGDWRRIGGQLRLVGLLAVNVPGFPVPKTRARVASGAPLALVAAGRPRITASISEEELDQRALRLMRDKLMARVMGKSEGVRE